MNKTLNFRSTKNQSFYSEWEKRDIPVIFAGKCVVCNRNTYQCSDGKGHNYDPDPRGTIPETHASASLVASEYSMTGKDIPVCFQCSNTRETYEKALQIAKRQWGDFAKLPEIKIN